MCWSSSVSSTAMSTSGTAARRAVAAPAGWPRTTMSQRMPGWSVRRSSASGPAATISPRRTKATRSHSASASAIECVARMTARFGSLMTWSLTRIRTSRALIGSSERVGSSMNRTSGSLEQAAGDPEPLAHARRVGPDRAIGIRGQVDALEELLDPRRPLAQRDVGDRREEDQVLATGHAPVERALLTGDEADGPSDLHRVALDVVAGHAGGPAGRTEGGREDPDERGLARAVLAEQPEQLAGRDLQADATERRARRYRRRALSAIGERGPDSPWLWGSA